LFHALQRHQRPGPLAGARRPDVTAIIPLLIVVSAVGSQEDSTAVADPLAARFHVRGALWMSRLIEANAARYGIIGITFAILTWLIVICSVWGRPL
jgi:hypothetical protein